MAKLDYTKLDAAVLSRLAGGPATFGRLTDPGPVMAAARALEKAHGNPKVKPAWRFIDARLQALRKRGAIRFVSQIEGWAVVPKDGAA